MGGRVLGFAVLLAAALGACSRPTADVPAQPAAAPKPVAPATAALPPAPVTPDGAGAIEAALKAAQDYDAAATAELAGIDAAEKRIHALAERAAGAAARGDGRGVAAAKSEADKARNGLASGLAALRTSAAAQTAAVETAVAQCAANPELAASEACVALAAQQATLAAKIEALTGRYQAAETAYAADRARLEEAAASVALGGLR